MRLRRIYAKYDFTVLVQEIIDAITPALPPPQRPSCQDSTEIGEQQGPATGTLLITG